MSITPVTWEAIAAADLLKIGGGWPTLAGWYDQPHSLREAMRFVAAHRAANDATT